MTETYVKYPVYMTALQMKVPKLLREKKKWNRWESSLAFAAVWPWLLSPDKDKRRDRIKTLHYLALLEKMVGVKGPNASAIRAVLVKRLRSRLVELAHTARIEWYRQQLMFEGATPGAYVAPVLTTGFLVKVLRGPDGVRNRKRVLSAAIDYLLINHQRGTVIRGDEDEAKKHWRKWKHSAHLCAALVDFLPPGSSFEINQAVLNDIEENMGAFIATAQRYEQFLAGEEETTKGEIPQATRRSFELARFVPLALSIPARVRDGLPAWDRKPNSNKGLA